MAREAGYAAAHEKRMLNFYADALKARVHKIQDNMNRICDNVANGRPAREGIPERIDPIVGPNWERSEFPL